MGSQYRENLKRQYGRSQPAQQSPDTLAVRDLIAEAPIVITATSSGVVFSGGINVSGSGIVGPGSSTNNAMVLWNGTGGNLVKDSNLTTDGAGNITGGTWTSNEITEEYGGTGQTTYAAGDILYADGADSLGKLSLGSANQILTVNGGLPSWQDNPVQTGIIPSSPVSDNRLARWDGTSGRLLQSSPITVSDAGDAAGLQDVDARTVRATVGFEGGSISGTWTGDTLTEAVGGTNQTTYTAGDILYASSSNTLSKLGVGSNGQYLSVSAGLPAWAAAPTGGGGGGDISGPGSSTDNALVRWDGAGGDTIQNSTVIISDAGVITSATWEGDAVGETFGGTGQITYASGDILYSDGSDSLGKLNVGSEGEVLTVVEGGLSWQPAATGAGGGGVSTLDGDAGGDAESTVVSGIHSREIDSTTPNIGDAYRWTGSSWAPSAVGSGLGGDFHIILGASGSPTTVVGRLNDPDTVLPDGWSGLDGAGSGPGGFSIDAQLSSGASADDIVFEHPAGFAVKVQLLLEKTSGLGAGIQWQPDHTFSTWFKSNTSRTQTRISDLVGKITSTDIVHIIVQLVV